MCSIKSNRHIILRKQVDILEKLAQQLIREIVNNQQIIAKLKIIHTTVQKDFLSQFGYSPNTQKCALTPTQKPVALVEEIIKTYTNEGETVLDSTAGSMTTGIAAIKTGRNVICVEKDKEIFDLGKNRVLECKKNRGDINIVG